MSCCRSHQAKTKEKLQQQHVQSDFGAVVVVVVVVVAMLLQQIAAASFVVDQDECFWNLLDPLPAASCTRISAPRYISAASVPSPPPCPPLPFPSLPFPPCCWCSHLRKLERKHETLQRKQEGGNLLRVSDY